jgi:hypothetical protein
MFCLALTYSSALSHGDRAYIGGDGNGVYCRRWDANARPHLGVLGMDPRWFWRMGWWSLYAT